MFIVPLLLIWVSRALLLVFFCAVAGIVICKYGKILRNLTDINKLERINRYIHKKQKR